MGEAGTYVIRTVGDFAAVPEDKLTLCLREFRVWLRMRAGAVEMNEALKAFGHPGFSFTDAYQWVDDDLSEAVLHVKLDLQSKDPEA